MKRLNLLVILFACPIMMFGQLKVNPSGDTYAGKNIFIGNSSNFLGTTANNVPILFKVGNDLVGNTGHSNNANLSFGYMALSNPLLVGNDNNAIGHLALVGNSIGSCNIAIGSYTLAGNSTGNSNTAIGFKALSNATGNNNTAIGFNALYYNENGSLNTAVGYYSGYSYPNGGQHNSTAIGSYALISADNQVRIGNNSVTSIGGYAGWSTVSDGRAKKNIRAEVPGLAFINLLQPVTYNLDLDAIDEIQKSDDPRINHLRDSLHMAASPEENEILAKARANKEKQVYSGFVAQDVEKAARSVGYDFSGVDAPENEKTAYGLRYAEFVVPLVKAVQELSEQNNRLQEQVNELNAKLDKLIAAPKQTAAGVFDESEVAKNFSFSIFPNPTNGFVTVEYTLYVDVAISIELYNIYGQIVKLIVPQQNQKTGTYSVQTSVVGLGTGTYIVKITGGNQIESKQLVVN